MCKKIRRSRFNKGVSHSPFFYGSQNLRFERVVFEKKIPNGKKMEIYFSDGRNFLHKNFGHGLLCTEAGNQLNSKPQLWDGGFRENSKNGKRINYLTNPRANTFCLKKYERGRLCRGASHISFLFN